MNANKFNSDTLKKAITRNMMKMMIAKITPSHFALALLNVEKTHKAKTIQTAKIINWMKLMENPITEKATQEKNHFLICWGNITFIYKI